MNKKFEVFNKLRRWASVLLLFFCAWVVYESNFFGATESEGHDVTYMLGSVPKKVFEPVLPDQPVVIPKDFQFHASFQHEWWHYFANVVGEDGQNYGIQWSYFRIANDDKDTAGWQSPQIYVSHVVVSSKDNVWREQRIARGGIGQAGMTDKPFRIWIDNWTWRSLGVTPFPGSLEAKTDTFSVSLNTVAKGPFALPGDKGYQIKHDLLPVASFNITAPFLDVSGVLTLENGKPIKVSGKAWMSKEWGSGLMAEGQIGWDWFVFPLDGNTTVSLNQYRHKNQMPYVFGMLATDDGKVMRLDGDDMTITPRKLTIMKNGKRIPLSWHISIPEHGVDVVTKVHNPNVWLPFIVPYWEGPISVSGSHYSSGFMQLTGY